MDANCCAAFNNALICVESPELVADLRSNFDDELTVCTGLRVTVDFLAHELRVREATGSSPSGAGFGERVVP